MNSSGSKKPSAKGILDQKNQPKSVNSSIPNTVSSYVIPSRIIRPASRSPTHSFTLKRNVETTNTRRHPSPVASRGRLAVESVTRKPVKVLTSETGTRSILKKSLDMAIKHMGSRSKGVRQPLPHNIRSSQPSTATASNNVNSKNGTGYMDNKVKPEHKSLYSSKLERVDVYESLRYDSIFLKEDLKNTSWLHGADEKSDQSLLFETLPEPFAP